MKGKNLPRRRSPPRSRRRNRRPNRKKRPKRQKPSPRKRRSLPRKQRKSPPRRRGANPSGTIRMQGAAREVFRAASFSKEESRAEAAARAIFNSGRKSAGANRCETKSRQDPQNYLPKEDVSVGLSPDAASTRADTAHAGRRAISPDALLGRPLLCGEISKQSATSKNFGERTARNQTGRTPGPADNSSGRGLRQRGTDPPYTGPVRGDGQNPRALPSRPAIRLPIPGRPPPAHHARFPAGPVARPGGKPS